MKKFLAAFCLSLLMFGASHAEENYDPQHTMLALNMAIVSVHRILTTGDRIVLEQEYQNIINNLSLGNIENDKDMTALYSDLTGIISRKGLRDEEAKFFRSRYDQREQNLINHALSRIQTQGENIVSLIGSFIVSCASSYFAYQAMKSDIVEDLRGEVWQLTKEDITDCNNLQERLLNSSWNLLRQYKLPEKYRLVQRVLDDFYKAVNEQDNAKRLRMLRALERDFQVYPPYWLYRGKTAQELGNIHEANTYFERFNEVWRPVLRKDPYKVEALKFGLSEIVKGENLSDEEKRRAIGLLEVMTENTPRDDWANNIFAGVAYFSIGSRDKGIEIIQDNIDFGYGAEMSKAILTQLKSWKLKPETTSSKSAEMLTPPATEDRKLEGISNTSEDPYDLDELAGKYERGEGVDKDEAEARRLYLKAAEGFRKLAEQGDVYEQCHLGRMYYWGNGVKKNYVEAAKWYRKAAEQGDDLAQCNLGDMYKKGEGVIRDYKIAYMWYSLATLFGLDCTRQLDKIEKGGFFSLPKISPSEAKEAKAEAQRKYDEIRKRYGLD